MTNRPTISTAWVAAKTTLPVVNPSDGQTIGQIGRGGADENRRGRARRPCGARWRMGPARRRLARPAAAAPRRPDPPRRRNSRSSKAKTSASPLAQARADDNVMARYFEYYGGAADKVHGETISVSRPVSRR